MSNAMVRELKEQGQDFEWYPTDKRMVDLVINGVKRQKDNLRLGIYSILDIGAGDGRVLDWLSDGFGGAKRLAIEKSRVLVERMNSNVFVIGSNFNTTSLVDKDADVIFCNPPYSEYDEWVARIIKESNAKWNYSEFRYNKGFQNDDEKEAYMKRARKLDYRLVIPNAAHSIKDKWGVGKNYHGCGDVLLDYLIIIARNLGFRVEATDIMFVGNGRACFYNGNSLETFFEYKSYLNGNVHLKFNVDFMARFNIKVGQLRQWLTSKTQAYEVFKDVETSIVDSAFDYDIKLGHSVNGLLGFDMSDKSDDKVVISKMETTTQKSQEPQEASEADSSEGCDSIFSKYGIKGVIANKTIEWFQLAEFVGNFEKRIRLSENEMEFILGKMNEFNGDLLELNNGNLATIASKDLVILKDKRSVILKACKGK